MSNSVETGQLLGSILTEEVKSVYIAPKLEKEPFKISLTNTKSFPYQEHVEDSDKIHELIQNLASKIIFHWTHVPMVFPQSIVGSDNDVNASETNSLFMFPQFNELDELSIDPSTRRPKKLNHQQLESIKKNGSFEVASAHFPGKFHRWQLAKFLQKGYDRSNETFFQNLSVALKLIIVTARDRLFANSFSVYSGLKLWKSTLTRLVDVLIGLPYRSLDYFDVNQTVRDELEKYLVEELTVVDSEKQEFKEATNKIFLMLKSNKDHNSGLTPLVLPGFYNTPDNLLIDLRLYNPSLMTKLEPVLNKFITNDSERAKLLIDMRQDLIKKYSLEGLSNQEITRRIEKALAEEYLKMLYENVSESKDLEAIASGIGKTLISHSRALEIMRQEVENMEERTLKHIEEYRVEMCRRHQVKSKVAYWLAQCVKNERAKYLQANLYTVHLKVIERCKNEHLEQAAYFIQRELDFLRQKKGEILRSESKNPNKIISLEFCFKKLIWNPKNYIIKQREDQTYYLESRCVEVKTNALHPFWRWKNYFLRTWCYSWNIMYLLTFILPFYSSVSFRALFAFKPFHVKRMLNKKTGVMEIDYQQAPIRTFVSRLSAIWQYVRKSRANFERQPDKGLLGKSVTRVFHRIWAYFFVGGIGSLGLTVVYPTLCLSISTVSLGLGLTTFLWSPVLSLVLHILTALIFDWELMVGDIKRQFSNKKFLVAPLLSTLLRLVFGGVIFPVFNLFTALLACPSLSVLIALIATVRKCFRKVQDTLFYHLVLRRLARVPSSDSFVARRTAGPGMACNHIYQMKPELALAAVEHYIDSQIADAFLEYIRCRLFEPLEVYKNVLIPICEPYSFGFSSNGDAYQRLSNEISEFYEKFLKLYEERTKNIQFYRTNEKVRLTKENLQIVLLEGTELVKLNYEHVIQRYKNDGCEKLFKAACVDNYDWTAYTGVLLERIFGVGILTPIEDTDDCFDLKVDHLNLAKYTKMINESKLRDDLDKVFERYSPKSKFVSISIPEKSFGHIFDTTNPPGSKDYTKRGNANSLDIPTALPGICAILVAVNNARSSGDLKINYESSLSSLDKRIERNFSIKYI